MHDVFNHAISINSEKKKYNIKDDESFTEIQNIFSDLVK